MRQRAFLLRRSMARLQADVNAPPMKHAGRIQLVVIALGAASMLLQVTALRSFLTVFSGSELDLGITLSVWLLGVGAGSFLAKGMQRPRALGLSVLAAGLLAPPLFSLIPAIRPFLALEAGETVPFGATVIMTVLLMAPVCALVGMHFPLAVRSLGGSAFRVFLLEAVGAFIAGAAYTFLLAGKAAPVAVLAATGAAYCALGSLLLGRAALFVLVAVPLLASFGIARVLPVAMDEETELVRRTESRYGTIEVFRAMDQYNVFASGKFLFSYPDPQNDELRTLLPLSLHPRPVRVLVAGGSPGAALALLRAPAVSVDHIELDPELIRAAGSLLGPKDRTAAAAGRVRFVADDARRYIKQLPAPRYDLIILNLPEPATANINRLYTVEFFREAKQALHEQGVLSLTLPASYGYVGKRMRAACGSIVASLQSVFRHVALSSEEYGIAAASDHLLETSPALLRQRLQDGQVRPEHLHPSLIDDAFDPLKTEQHRQRLAGAARLNSDARPVAYLYTLLVWAEMQRSGALQYLIDHGRAAALAAAAMAVIAGIVAFLRRASVSYTVFSAGFASMASSLVLVLAYQSAFGYVYERVGLLTAAFMAGSAAGACVVRNLARPFAALKAAEAAGAALLLATPLLLRTEVLYLVLMALLGGLGGAAYVAAVNCGGGGDAAGRAGRLYALDLAGAFLGALLAALALVPLFGVLNTLLGMVLCKMLSLIFLAASGNEPA